MDALEISTFGEPSDVVEAEPGSPCTTWDYRSSRERFKLPVGHSSRGR